MSKKCFVIMPISDCESYCPGHFLLVYEYIIKPACVKAGFEPVRADEVRTTNLIALDVIKHVINSDMCLCDLSGQNPNVLYELGIRQAFNKPVTIIKDDTTERIFDIQGIRDVEYDHTLRVDLVGETVDKLAEMLTNTYEKVDEVNSLVKLLGIEAARVSDKTKISVDTELILSAINELEKRVANVETKRVVRDVPPMIKDIPDGVGERMLPEEVMELKNGERVFHPNWGYGHVVNRINYRESFLIRVDFDGIGKKTLGIKATRLRRVLD